MLWTKKNSCEEFDHEKKIPAARKSPPPPITFFFFAKLYYCTRKIKHASGKASSQHNVVVCNSAG